VIIAGSGETVNAGPIRQDEVVGIGLRRGTGVVVPNCPPGRSAVTRPAVACCIADRGRPGSPVTPASVKEPLSEKARRPAHTITIRRPERVPLPGTDHPELRPGRDSWHRVVISE